MARVAVISSSSTGLVHLPGSRLATFAAQLAATPAAG